MNKSLIFNIRLIIGIIFLAFSAPAFAERAPNTMGKDSRVRHVNYNPTDVIRIDTHVSVNTAIEVGQGERISQVLLGDSESFEVEVLSNRNVISVKPIVNGVKTNMTVYTNRRTISFFLTEGRHPHTFRVVIRYPEKKRPTRTAKAVSPRDAGYKFSGKGKGKPVRVWNNGTHTFFEMATDVRPSIFSVNSDGYEVTTNSVTRGRIIRVNGIRDEYALRIETNVICIRHSEGGLISNQEQNTALAGQEF